MAEWLKAAVLKTAKGESSSRVRIPLSPPVENTTLLGGYFLGRREASKLLCLWEGFERRNDVFSYFLEENE